MRKSEINDNTSDIADTLSGCRGVPFVVLTCLNYSRLGVVGEKLIEIKTCCIDKNYINISSTVCIQNNSPKS